MKKFLESFLTPFDAGFYAAIIVFLTLYLLKSGFWGFVLAVVINIAIRTLVDIYWKTERR